MLTIKTIANTSSPENALCDLIELLHNDGPVDNRVIENLTYFRMFHSDIFEKYEERILSVLGLFYKNKEPDDLYSYILGGIGRNHKEKFGEFLTPVQASVRAAVESNQFVSISAPTSAGKSFALRDYIFELQGNSVIIVPSRALIAEYIKTLKDKFKDDKGVMISSFVDYVFTDRDLRRIFVLTPERARDLFLPSYHLDISLFFFDEAQISEEQERGVIFDVLVRRAKENFPRSKLIFAHPFVDNPDAQMKKHGIDEGEAYARAYPHNTVGKAFIFNHRRNGKDFYFSPYTPKGHHVSNSIELTHSFEDEAFDGTKTVLVFVSKASIYRGDFIDDFEKYVDNFEEMIDDQAKEIVGRVEDLLGANEDNHKSKLVELLRRGVVIHHGSVPLDVRFLVEDFIRAGYAKICFATSTLAQGINMPFDIVWLDNMRIQGSSDQDRALSFKNLIGRSGRLSKLPTFDYGYVYTKSPKLLADRVNLSFNLSNDSKLDMDLDGYIDERELVTSIIEGTFDEETNLPQSKVERLSSGGVKAVISEVLKLVYRDEFGERLFGRDNRENRDLVKTGLLFVYETSLGRSLYDGERNVFNTAIEIFFHVIQGRSFKEIVGIRYSNISKRGGDGNEEAGFTQPANKLPDSNLQQRFSLFNNIRAKDVSYDAVVFDTYDYLDTVLSFSLSDVLMGAMLIYHQETKDGDALKMVELLKYGTNDTTHTLLIRYGFPPDEVSEISRYVEGISEANIKFKDEVSTSSEKIQELVSWYLPE